MIEVSERSARTAASAAPDWALVLFEVGCARCGHDLRGLADPRCPACGLEFEWSEAVPLEDLKCPMCEYRLQGLSETRCPECGRAFTWDGVLTAAHRRRLPLFEYRWRDHPLTSLLRTWVRTMRPRRFWSEMNLHDRPRPGPLVVMAALAFVPVAIVLPLLDTISSWLFPVIRWGRPVNWSTLLLHLRWGLESMLQGRVISLGLVWAAATFGALLVFRWSMRRINVRRVQVLRVWAYAVPAWPMVLLTLVSFLGKVSCGSLMGTPAYFSIMSKWYLFLDAVLIGHITWSICQGYKRYLRMPHAAAVAIASQIIAALTALILWRFLGGVDPAHVIDFVLDAIIGEDWALNHA